MNDDQRGQTRPSPGVLADGHKSRSAAQVDLWTLVSTADEWVVTDGPPPEDGEALVVADASRLADEQDRRKRTEDCLLTKRGETLMLRSAIQAALARPDTAHEVLTRALKPFGTGGDDA